MRVRPTPTEEASEAPIISELSAFVLLPSAKAAPVPPSLLSEKVEVAFSANFEANSPQQEVGQRGPNALAAVFAPREPYERSVAFVGTTRSFRAAVAARSAEPCSYKVRTTLRRMYYTCALLLLSSVVVDATPIAAEHLDPILSFPLRAEIAMCRLFFLLFLCAYSTPLDSQSSRLPIGRRGGRSVEATVSLRLIDSVVEGPTLAIVAELGRWSG